MPNVPVLKPREVIRVLETIGFREVRQQGSHKQFRHLFLLLPPEGRQGPMTTGTVLLNTVAVMRRFSARAGLKLTA